MNPSEQARADVRLLTGLGIRLFPVSDKRPTWAGWQTHASTDLAVVSRMVEFAQDERRYGGLGAVTGERHVVLDIDDQVGFGRMLDLARSAGEPLIQPDHLVGRTPRRGWHLWYTLPPDFEQSPGNRTHLLDVPVDFRGRGGLAVVLGRNRTLEGSTAPPMPDWLITLVDASDPPTEPERLRQQARMGGLTEISRDNLLRMIEDAPEGNRNGLLFWASCRAWEGWLYLSPSTRGSAEDLGQTLCRSAEKAGLTHSEAVATVRSAQATVWKEQGVG
ncbi:bifunctional DNA primase/polymerase [Isoptericola cucumis]|uniref:bifunctional DNA primase/polymerase n=1 Tax=Isoptericola cucumis TaxID=1776856 RepID=UPI00320AB353